MCTDWGLVVSCPGCGSKDFISERRPDGYHTCRSCGTKWRTSEAELWALRERVKELEKRLAERDAKPETVPTPKELVQKWRKDPRLGWHQILAETQNACADDLEASLAAHPTSDERLMDLLSTAWGVIANVSGGEWPQQSPDWQAAAARWRDAWSAVVFKTITPWARPRPAT
jgi:hypothetical protein